MPGQHHSERLEHQGVTHQPEVDLLAVSLGDAVQQAEAVTAPREFPLKARFLGRPVAAEVPDVGVVGIVTPSLAQPREGGIEGSVRGEVSEEARSARRDMSLFGIAPEAFRSNWQRPLMSAKGQKSPVSKR